MRTTVVRAACALVVVLLVAVTCFGVTPKRTQSNIQTTEKRLHIEPLQPNSSRYAYVPFVVPQNCRRVTVDYEYDRAGGANTIDIGLFDANWEEGNSSGKGFRGWSGGRRPEFTITRSDATPGYLPGNLPPGTWRVILGLYKISSSGVDVTIKVTTETGDDAASGREFGDNTEQLTRPSARAGAPSVAINYRPRVAPAIWYAGDLHMHTVHSDGNWTVAELAKTAKEQKLDFIVITDHNTSSHHREIDQQSAGFNGLLVMRGEEVTTYGGHLNAWGLKSGEWLDFRFTPGDSGALSAFAADAHKRKVAVSINHPFALCGGCSWIYKDAAPSFDAIEVWNSSWDPTDEMALKWWDDLLKSGLRLTAMGSSDSHKPENKIGLPSVHVKAETLSESDILDGIWNGHVYITAANDGPKIDFRAKAQGDSNHEYGIGDVINMPRPGSVKLQLKIQGLAAGSTLRLISNEGVAKEFHPAQAIFDQTIPVDCKENSYFRIEIRDAEKQMLAFSNPIYVRVG
jgi:hypothetical protein